ncbi:hypothetical protein PC128_g17971 [Phytophthora cactorum]|nr:hypothetical protein PC120_g19257 [Phytophthora cactorum]KAG3059365.1 hypothetical protein PC121_g13962 [Phytophthora cactorum]KAG3174671.1 hypothetical protein PC128_g17971 [Phytophthora cactorum]
MPTIAQLRAEIDWLNQAMADRTRVPSNLPKYTGKRGEDVREWLFQIENAYRINNIQIEDTRSRLPGIAGSAMEKPASGWLLHWSSTTREEEHTEKLQRLKQIADIETYNGEYSALIFRVEGMSVLDQVLGYANGLKPRTRSYVKLENPETLSEAMDLTVKYKVTHFVDEVRDRQARQDKRRSSVEQGSSREKSFKGKPFRGKGLFKPRPDSKRAEDRTCFHCKKPGHIKANCFLWKMEQGKQGNGQPRR